MPYGLLTHISALLSKAVLFTRHFPVSTDSTAVNTTLVPDAAS